MDLLLQIEVLSQVALAALLSMVVGLNRERRDKPAGLRTHMLAGIGACIFTIVGLYAFPDADRSRVAASVVEGVGFLGAGTIFRSENRVQALTTAASIWATAAIGVAVGAGVWLLAIGGAVIIWFVLAILYHWEQAIFENDE